MKGSFKKKYIEKQRAMPYNVTLLNAYLT